MTRKSETNTLTVVAGVTAATLAVGAAAAYWYQDAIPENPVGTFYNYLIGEDEVAAEKAVVTKVPAAGTASMEKADVQAMLRQIASVQEQTKTFLKTIVESLAAQPKPLAEVYETIKAGTPEDPIMSSGISMDEFDVLLSKFETDDEIKCLIDTIMGNEMMENVPEHARNLTIKEIIDVHKFMYVELRKVVEEATHLKKSGGDFESRFITMAGQALVGAKVYDQFKLHPQEIEAAMMLNFMSLQYESEFLKVSVEIQASISVYLSQE